MSNEQLWLAIGVPSVLVVLSWIQQNARMARSEAVNDRRFDAIDQKFDGVDRKFDAMRSEMIALRDSVHRDMVTLHER
jgi:hypothetical protein